MVVAGIGNEWAKGNSDSEGACWAVQLLIIRYFFEPLMRHRFTMFTGRANVYSNQVKKTFDHEHVPQMNHGKVAYELRVK